MMISEFHPVNTEDHSLRHLAVFYCCNISASTRSMKNDEISEILTFFSQKRRGLKQQEGRKDFFFIIWFYLPFMNP